MSAHHDDIEPTQGRTLPGRYFTSDNVFAIEREKLFHEKWFCVGRQEALATPGDYFLADVAGESVIVTSNEHGQSLAFFNVCRHRGTRLVCEASGRFSRCQIQCPYHRWTYDGSGRLIAAPHMDETMGFDRDDWPLLAIQVAAWEGFLFVNLSGSPESLKTAFGSFIETFRTWRVSDLRVVHREEYEAATNWKMLFENFNECYHCISVHPGLNDLSPVNACSNNFEKGPFLGGAMELASESMTTTGSRTAPPIRSLEPDDRRRVYYYTLLPNMMFALHPDFVVAWRIVPCGPGKTRIVVEWLFEPESIDLPDFDPGPAIQFWDKTNRQDWAICEQSYLGVCSRAYLPGPWSSQESMPRAFDEEYLRVLGQEGPWVVK